MKEKGRINVNRKLKALGLTFALMGLLLGCGSKTTIIDENTSNENREGEFLTAIKNNSSGFNIVGIKDEELYVLEDGIASSSNEDYFEGRLLNRGTTGVLTPSGKLTKEKEVDFSLGNINYGKSYSDYGVYDFLKENYDVKLDKSEFNTFELDKNTGSFSKIYGRENAYLYKLQGEKGVRYIIFEENGKRRYFSENIPLSGGGDKERVNGYMSFAYDSKSSKYIGVKDDGVVYEGILNGEKLVLKEIGKVSLEKNTYVFNVYSIDGEIFIDTSLDPYAVKNNKDIDDIGGVFSLIHYDGKSKSQTEIFRAKKTAYGVEKEIIGVDYSGNMLLREEIALNSEGGVMRYETYLAKLTKDGIEKRMTVIEDSDHEFYDVNSFLINEGENKIGFTLLYQNLLKDSYDSRMYGLKEIK